MPKIENGDRDVLLQEQFIEGATSHLRSTAVYYFIGKSGKTKDPCVQRLAVCKYM
jgi:hypothetical protein